MPPVPDSRPIAQVSHSTALAPSAGPWWRRRPSGLAVALGTAAALAAAILLGLFLSPSFERAPAEEVKAQAAPTTPAQAVERLTFAPAQQTYRPPDDSAVREAYTEAQGLLRQGGVSALTRRGLNCFEGLAQRPSYRLMDYCLAFDLFADALNARTAGGAQPSPTSWLGSSGARHLNVAQAIMGPEGDAEARLFDLRRAAAGLIGAEPPPPLPAYGLRVVVEPPPAPELTGAPTAAPTVAPQVAPTQPSRAPAPRAERTAPRLEQPPPPALQATSPSFNCRYARTRSEQMVCGDPGLAAADRALDRAFREAIRAGQSASELRRAQDRWLSVREEAASSAEAVAQVYARRIAELEALAR